MANKRAKAVVFEKTNLITHSI